MVTCLEDGSVTSQITNQSFVLPDASEQKTEANFPFIFNGISLGFILIQNCI